MRLYSAIGLLGRVGLAYVVAGVAIGGLLPVAGASVVYQQVPRPAQAFTWSASRSEFTPGQESSQAVTADSFSLPAAATITGVRFWGRSAFTVGTTPPPGFQLRVWSSDGTSANGASGAPGTLVASHTLSTTDAGFTSSPPSDAAPLEGANVYEALLPAALQLSPNTRYWLSIAAIRPDGTASTGWGWWDSFEGTGLSANYNTFSSASWFVLQSFPNQPQGRAWALIGVPTPSAAAGLMAGGVLVMRRRRNSRGTRTQTFEG